MNIVSKLTLRYLKKNKITTILTIIGISISVATVSGLDSIIYSFVDNIKEDNIESEGAYDFKIVNSNPQTDAKVSNIRNIKTSYKLKKESISRTEHRDDNLDLNYFIGLDIIEASDAFFDEFVPSKFLVEGNMPKNDTEILVPYDMKFMGIGFENLGNTISVGVNKALEGEYSFSKPFSINYLRKLNGEKLLTQKEYNENILSLDYSIDEYYFNEEKSEDSISKEELIEKLNNFSVTENDLRNLVNEFSETKTYTIVGYHSGNSENIINNKEFAPFEYYKFSQNNNEYLQDTKNLIFSGQIYTISNKISENYNTYGIFSNYNNIKSDVSEINKILEKSGKLNDLTINSILIQNKNFLKSNFGLYILSIVGILEIIILISIVVFVYNIFTSTYVERLKDLGLLKVVGFTNKQLLKMILLDSFVYFIISVPLGYLFGTMAMNLVFNYVNKAIVEISVISPYTFSVKVGYIIPLISSIFGFLVIFASNIMSSIFVFRQTPIDALKANNFIKTNYKPRRWRLLKKVLGYDGFISSRHIDQNKKRFLLTTLSIAMSITMFTAVSNISILFENKLYEVDKNKESIYGSVVTLDKYADQLKSDFTSIRGINIESTQKFYSLNLIQKENLLDGAIENNYIISDIQVVTMNHSEFEKTFGDVNNIYYSSKTDNHKKGDKYEITLIPLENQVSGQSYYTFSNANVDAKTNLNVIKKNFSDLESQKINYFSKVLFMTEYNYEKLLKNTGIKELESRTIILINRDDYDYRTGYELNAILKKYPTTGISLKKVPLFNMLKLFVYGFTFLIMSIFALNIISISYTNTYSRREELAFLKTVGIENKRLKRILLYENMISVILAIFISFILSLAISYLVYILAFEDILVSNSIQTYVIPLKAWAISSVVSVLLIYIFVSIPYNRMMKNDITDILK